MSSLCLGACEGARTTTMRVYVWTLTPEPGYGRAYFHVFRRVKIGYLFKAAAIIPELRLFGEVFFLKHVQHVKIWLQFHFPLSLTGAISPLRGRYPVDMGLQCIKELLQGIDTPTCRKDNACVVSRPRTELLHCLRPIRGRCRCSRRMWRCKIG
jgi:hypothetical protein